MVKKIKNPQNKSSKQNKPRVTKYPSAPTIPNNQTTLLSKLQASSSTKQAPITLISPEQETQVKLLDLPTPIYKAQVPAVITKLNRPLLTVAMMVKNEEEFLEDALKSIINFADEIVVVDTGSVDKTMDIARSFDKVKTSYFEWPNDFSAGRNETIRRSSGEWIFILDADERLDTKHKNKQAIYDGYKNMIANKLPTYPYDAILLNVINQRLNGTEISSLFNIRTFPNHPHLKYKNRVHNQLVAELEDGTEKPLNMKTNQDIHLIHLGYDESVYARKQKTARSLPLIQAMVQDDPNNHVYAFYLGREYTINRMYPEAIDVLEKTYQIVSKDPTAAIFDEVLKTLLHTYEIQNQLTPELMTRLTEYAREGVKRSPNQPDHWFYLAMFTAMLGDMNTADVAIQNCVTTLHNFKLTHAMQSNPYLSAAAWKAYDLAATVFWNLGKKKESYDQLKRTFNSKPVNGPNWTLTLRCLVTLAKEFNEEDWITQAAKKAAVTPTAIVEIFYFKIERLIHTQNLPEIKDLLNWALVNAPRLHNEEQFKKFCEMFIPA